MPSGPLAHICLLVKDLDKAIEDWTKLLEILDPAQLEERIVRYDAFEGGEDKMRWATFVNAGGAEIQLMEPDPDSPLGRRLAKHGEGVHHICFTTDNPEETSRRLAAAGISTSGEVSSDPTMPWQRWTWVLPDSAHGTLVEVARPYIAVDGKWDSANAADRA
jgi:methylmalonyl-CoA/ethylmalonyl-CoA epimerase